ncbi:MAG: HEPN domain-containing protein [Solirubrobacterales bacterium]|jgi:HEPN domain-containing protein|nr:HEPN domain-containing protein [Solirubrobacterales bacterium]
MLDAPEFTRWRRDAASALRSAELQADGGLHNWACFAAEQAAQLAVKALLHGVGAAPWGHDLEDLGRRLTDAGVPVPAELEASLLRLKRLYIPARYADAHPGGAASDQFLESDARAAIEDAEAVLRFVDDAWQRLAG